MSESLRQAIVDFLNLQGEAVYPAAAIQFDTSSDLCIEWRNPGAKTWDWLYVNPQDLSEFLLEYTIV